ATELDAGLGAGRGFASEGDGVDRDAQQGARFEGLDQTTESRLRHEIASLPFRPDRILAAPTEAAFRPHYNANHEIEHPRSVACPGCNSPCRICHGRAYLRCRTDEV